MNSAYRNLLTLTLILMLVVNHPHINYVKGENSKIVSDDHRTLSLAKIFKEPEFLQEFNLASRNADFRVLVKLKDHNDKRLLSMYGKNIKEFNSYSGFAVTINKEHLWYLMNKGIIDEVWNNSIIQIPSFENLNESHSSKSESNNNYKNLNYEGRTIVNFTAMIEAESLWSMGYYGNNTIVAVLDTGIALNQPNLIKDLNGEDKIIKGWNFVDNSTDFSDDNGHGTAVASIIAGSGLGGQIKGVAPNAKLLIGKILDGEGKGTIEALLSAIDWAIKNGADVINLSSGRAVYTLDPPEVEAVNYAVDKGVVVCVAAGNERAVEAYNYNDLYTILSPGIASKAITVGAIDSNKVLYEHSSAGPVAVNYNLTSQSYLYYSIDNSYVRIKPDLVAPGVMLNVTGMGIGTTRIVSGTSFATAVVSGACSLLRERFPEYFSTTVKGALLESAKEISLTAIDPENSTISTKPYIFFQGAGLLSLRNALDYFLFIPSFSIWPKTLPTLNKYLFINTVTEFVFSIFINQPGYSVSTYIGTMLRNIFSIHDFPSNFEVGQYDFKITIDARYSNGAFYKGNIDFKGENCNGTIPVELSVRRAYGRMLIDSFVKTSEVKYTPYGNLLGFISYAQINGLLPILPSENLKHSLHLLNLNDYELLMLANFDGAEDENYSQEDIEALKDYLLPKGQYGGGTIVVFPTASTDFAALNSFLEPIGITCSSTTLNYEFLDVASSSILFGYPYMVHELYIPHPINVTTTNYTVLSYQNRFAQVNFRINNGSQLIVANNLQMLLSTPYLYSPEKNDYNYDLQSFYFRDNAGLLKNIFFLSVSTALTVKFDTVNPEIRENTVNNIRVTIHNSYKYMPGWKLCLSFEQGEHLKPTFVKVFTDVVDYQNGTYLFSFIPSKIGLKPGEYRVTLRSLSGTWDIPTGEGPYKNTIYVLATISWGPILVETSLVVCLVYLYTLSKKKHQKTVKSNT